MSEESLHERVKRTVLKIMYLEEELPTDGSVPEGAVMSQGLVRTFGFHPERLKQETPIIKALVQEIVADEFLKGKGGGHTFLNLCVDRKGVQWGEHQEMEALFCMAQAIGDAGFCMPRTFWAALPGGMPYVWFSDGVEAAPTATTE
jgi:hypothetical protein